MTTRTTATLTALIFAGCTPDRSVVLQAADASTEDQQEECGWFQGGSRDGALSPDGELIASAGAHGLSLIRVADGTVLKTFDQGQITRDAAFSPNGALVAAIQNDQIKIWHVQDQTFLRALEYPGELSALAFSPDGATIAGGGLETGPSPARLFVWRLSDGALVRALEAQQRIFSIAYSKDGTTLASAAGVAPPAGARIWNAADGAVINTIEGNIDTIALSPDGSIIATSRFSGEDVAIYKTSDGTLIRRLDIDDSVRSVALSPDGRELAIGLSTRLGFDPYDTIGQIAIYNAADGVRRTTIQHRRYTHPAASFSADGTLVFSSAGDHKLFKSSDGSEVAHFDVGAFGFGRFARFAADGASLVTAGGDGARRLRIGDGATLRRLELDQYYEDLVLSPEARLIAAFNPLKLDAEQAITVWNIENNLPLAIFPSYTRPLAFSPNGTELLVQEAALEVWNLPTQSLARSFPIGPGTRFAEISHDATIAALGVADGVKLIDYATGDTRGAIPGTINAVAFSPDDTIFVTAGRELELWRTSRTELITQLATELIYIEAITFSPDGRLLAAIDDSRIEIWRMEDQKLLSGSETTQQDLQDISFSKDGRMFAIAGASGTIFTSCLE